MLRLWIETGAAYPGTYAALGTGMLGEYRQNALQHPDLQWASTKAAMEVMSRRCATCHGKGVAPPLPQSTTDDKGKPPWEPLRKDDHREWLSRHLVYNLSRPEKSLLLLAPLSKSAGGYGFCKSNLKSEIRLSEAAKSEIESWRRLYLEARWVVRELMFRHPALNFDELLFVKRTHQRMRISVRTMSARRSSRARICACCP